MTDNTLKNARNQTIALAGIAQASALVHQLATNGRAQPQALEASFGSLLQINAESVPAIYGDVSGVKLGLMQLRDQLTGREIKYPEQARYAAALVFLERRLADRPDLLERIRTGIEKAQAQEQVFGLMHDNVLASLADVYQNTLSTLSPRIMVHGDENYLSQPDIVNKVRISLLAGVRAALLWRQCGGSRWKFLWQRVKLREQAEQLLDSLQHS
ncbi:MAG: high frequency lysogenization protein HflD [Methylococcales bacterium]|nr:high frequency lysogenization protein HflD [Methylococcales bacterium]